MQLIFAFRSDFTIPQQIIEPLRNSTNTVEVKEPLIASSLKVLEPPTSLRRLADYRKKMMIDHEGSIVLASISGNNSNVNADVPDQPISSRTSQEILGTQVQTKSEPPNSPLSLTLVSDPCEPTPPPSNGRKLNLEFVAVRLPTPILVPSKDMPELPGSQLIHEQDISPKPEVAIRVSISTPAPTSVVDSGIDVPVPFPLEEPTACSGIVMRSHEQDHSEPHNILAPPMDVQEIVELPAAPVTVLTDKNASLQVSPLTTSIVPGSRKSLLVEASQKKTSTGSVQKADNATKSSRRKPVVVNTENPLTNYFKPVSITLTADDDDDDDDDDDIDGSRKGNARTIHLSIETSDNNVTTSAVSESKTCFPSLKTTDGSHHIVPKHAEVLEDSQVPSVSSVEVSTTTKEDVECEVSDWQGTTLSPVKVVVEKVEDFILTKTFSALETTPPLNIEHDKEMPSHEVSSSSRRKAKSPLKRNPGDPKLPPFKSNSKTVQQMQKKERCKEMMPEDKLSKSSHRFNKRKGSEKPKPLKCSTQSNCGSKHGSDGQVVKVIVKEAETTSLDNPSPSLLPTASGRTSRTQTKQTRSKKTKSNVIENDVALPHNGEVPELPIPESQHKSLLHSLKILDDVKTKKHNGSRSRKPLSIKDLNDCKQVKIDDNDSSSVCNVKSIKQNIASCHGSSKARLRKVSGDTCSSNEPSKQASNEAVDVKVSRQNVLNSTKTMKPHLEMQETAGKVNKKNPSNNKVFSKSTDKEAHVKDVKSRDQNLFSDDKFLKLNNEAQTKSTKFTKQNILNSNDTLQGSSRVQVTDIEFYKQNPMNSSESLEQVHSETAASEVKTCSQSALITKEALGVGIQNETVPCLETSLEASTINITESLGIGIQNETLPCLETSTEVRTSRENAYNMVKEEQDSIVKNTYKCASSHKSSKSVTADVSSSRKDVKSTFPKVKLVNYTPTIEMSVSQLKEEKEVSSNDADPKPCTRFRRSTSKLKSSVTLLGSDGNEMNQDKPANTLGQTSCNLELDITPTEIERGRRKRTRTQYDDSLVRIEGVSLKKRRRKLFEAGLEDDLNTVEVSSQRSRSSCHQQSSSNTSVEDNLISLLKKCSSNSLSEKPEMLAASALTTTREEISILTVTETTAVLTSTEVSSVTTPTLAATVTAGCPSEGSILPPENCVLPETLVSEQSCEDQAVKEGFSVTVNGNMNGCYKEENFPVERVISSGKVMHKQRSEYSTIDENKRMPGNGPHKLHLSTNKLDEHIEDILNCDTVGSDFSSMSSTQKPMSLHVSDLKTQKSVNSKYQASEHPEELDVQTPDLVSDVAELSQKQIFKKSSMDKPYLKTSLQPAETTSCISESEVTLPCVEILNTNTRPKEVHVGSQKDADSEDVIESSQDSCTSLRIVSRLPLMHKCSVSVCRIDTTLEPGAEINVSQGDQKLMVLVPEDTGSPFKVYTPDKTQTVVQQEKPAKAVCEMEKAHHTKLSATRCLYDKSAGVINQIDSVQDKPNTSLDNNSSGDESMKEAAHEVSVSRYVDSIPTTRNDIPKSRSKKQTTTSKYEGNILNFAKTDSAKPKSKQIFDTLTPKEGVPTVVTDDTPKSTPKQQISMSEPEVSFLVVNVDDPLKLRPRKNSILKSVDGIPSLMDKTLYSRLKSKNNKSETEDSIVPETEDNTSKSISKQQFDRSKHLDNILMTVKYDTPKTSLKEQIDTVRPESGVSALIIDDASKSRRKVSEDSVSTFGEEDTPKHQSKQHINTSKSGDNVSTATKEDSLKQSKQQINTSVSMSNMSVVINEESPRLQTKQHINTSGFEVNVSTFGEEDILKPQSKQQINTSVTNDNISTVGIEDTLKLQSKKQINTSESEDYIPPDGKEDVPEPLSKQKVNTSESENNVSTIGKEGTSKPQYKQQINTSVSKCKVSVVSSGDTPKLRSRQQVNTSEFGNNISGVCEEDIPKPHSNHEINNISVCDDVLTVSSESIPKLRSKKQINALKSEDNISLVCKEVTSEPQSKQQVNTSLSKGNVSVVNYENTPKFSFKQQVNTPKSEGSVTRAGKEDTPNLRSKQQINVSVSKDNILTVRNEDIRKLRSKKQINTSKYEENVSAVGKEDNLKPRSMHQIKISVSSDNVLTVSNEDTPKLRSRKQIHISKSEDNTPDTLKTQSKQQINTSKSEDNISKGSKEDTPKPLPKQQINFSVISDNVSTVRNEDTPKLRSKHQTNTPKSEDCVSAVGKEDTQNPHSNQQINTSESENNISSGSKEDSLKPQPKHQTNTSKFEDNVSRAGEVATPKPQLKHHTNISISKGTVSTVHRKETLKLQSKKHINASEFEDNISAVGKEGNTKPKSKQQISTSTSKDSILSTVKEDTQKPKSKQEISTSVSEDGILLAVKENASKPKSKQQINTSECEDNILTAAKEDIPKPQSRQQIETSEFNDCILTTIKDDTLEPRTKRQIGTSKSEFIFLTDASKPQLKCHVNVFQLDSASVTDTQDLQSKQQTGALKPEDGNISVVKDDTPKRKLKPGLNSSNHEEKIEIFHDDTTIKLRSKHKGMYKKVNQDSKVKSGTDMHGTKTVLRSNSAKMLSKDEPVKGETQHSVTPKSVSMNHYKEEGSKETKENNVSKPNHKTSNANCNHKAFTQQKTSDNGNFIENASNVKKAVELNETNISKGDSELSLPLQSRKRPAISSHMLLEVPLGQVNSHLDPIDTGASKMKRLPQSTDNLSERSACIRSPVSTSSDVKLCDGVSSNSDKTPSPTSPKSILSSPSSLLRAFSSPSGSLDSNQNYKSHHKRTTGGRAHYMVGLAVAVNDMETSQTSSPTPPQRPEESRSIIAVTPSSLPPPKKKLVYVMSDGDTEPSSLPLER